MESVSASERLIAQLFDNQPDAVVWFKPLFDDAGEVVDFELHYANLTASRILHTTIPEMLGTRLRTSGLMDESSLKLIHEQAMQVWKSGQSLEFTYYSPGLDRYFNVQRSVVEGGVLNITRDRTSEVRANLEREEQGELIKGLFEQAPYGIIYFRSVRDEEGNIIDFKTVVFNEKAAHLIGFNSEELKRYSSKEMIRIRGNHGFFDQAVKVMTTGQATEQEYYSPSMQKHLFYSMRPHGDGLFINFIDVTHRVQLEEEFKQQAHRLEKILQHSPSGITIIRAVRNEDGKVTDVQHILVNDQAEKFIGYSKEQLLNNSNGQLDPGFAESHLLKEMIHTLETGETMYTNYRIPTGHWIEGAAARMDDDHLLCLFSDVTSFKENQQKTDDLLGELKRSNKNLEEFAYAASHDLQEPLRKIQFFADRLKKELGTSTEEADRALLDRILSASLRMSNLINDLLNYSQVSMKPGSVERIDLNEALDMVLQDLETTIADTNALVHREPLPHITGDERQLRQLFANLIGNAIKYHKENQRPEVSIRYRTVQHSDPVFKGHQAPAGKYHLIEISDNGIGFDPEDAERIFNVFTRLHGNSEYPGTGVGLAIVKRVAINHKAFVFAEGRPGSGATFRLLIAR